MAASELPAPGWAPDLSGFTDPVPLVRRAQGAPPRAGTYVISCGDCVSHIGTSGNLQGRIRSLAALGNHRGSTEVLCAAFCSKRPPMVRWRETGTSAAAREIERALKALGEPPQPRDRFAACVNGDALRRILIDAAGDTTWEAGYIDALFNVGEQLNRLFTPRFKPIWLTVGWPPGPWIPA